MGRITRDGAPVWKDPSFSEAAGLTSGATIAPRGTTAGARHRTPGSRAPPGLSSSGRRARNSLNQYTAVGSASPTSDGNGSLTFDGTYTFSYDPENRLVSASGAGNTASYAFDGRGWRKLKTVNGTTTISIIDADNREVLEYDGTSGAILRWYVYALGPNAVLNQMNVGASTRSTLLPDIQGSIAASMDSGTATLSPFGYQPYGSTASAPAQFGYNGQRVDAETALYYYRARHYSPAWGRLLQADPLSYYGEMHLYAYVNNDPLNNTDPDGQFCIPCAFAVGGAAIGLAVQGYHDYEAGHFSSIGNYAGAATAGAIGGLSLLAGGGIGTTALIGAAGGFAGNTVQQGIDIATGAQQGYSVTSALASTAAGGFTAGALKPFSGVIASEYGPISQGLITKYANGTISQAAPSTVANMLATETLEENVIPGAILGDKFNDVLNQNLPSVKIGGSLTSSGK